MKLSEKGLKKIQRWQDAKQLGHAYPVDEIKFEHDDFEGFITLTVNIPRSVFLTVEEAKRLHDCAMFFWSDYEGTKYFTNDDKRFLTDIKNRIEQAEMSKQST